MWRSGELPRIPGRLIFSAGRHRWTFRWAAGRNSDRPQQDGFSCNPGFAAPPCKRCARLAERVAGSFRRLCASRRLRGGAIEVYRHQRCGPGASGGAVFAARAPPGPRPPQRAVPVMPMTLLPHTGFGGGYTSAHGVSSLRERSSAPPRGGRGRAVTPSTIERTVARAAGTRRHAVTRPRVGASRRGGLEGTARRRWRASLTVALAPVLRRFPWSRTHFASRRSARRRLPTSHASGSAALFTPCTGASRCSTWGAARCS